MEEPHTKRVSPESANDWSSPIQVRAIVLMAAIGVGIYFYYWMTAPFLPALAWALALAVLFAPVHRWLESALKRPNLAATFSVTAIAVVAVVPATFVADQIIGEAAKGAETIRASVESGEWRRAFDAHPTIAPVGNWIERQLDLPGLVQTAASWLTNTATSFVQGSILQLIAIIVTFYILFYYLRDQDLALESLRSLSPLSKVEMNRLFVDVFDTVRATVYGTLAVAAVRGSLGGLMF